LKKCVRGLIILLTLLFISNPSYGNIEQRVWYGFGQANGHYSEDKSGISEPVTGRSDEFMIDHKFNRRNFNKGQTRSFSVLDTGFDENIEGSRIRGRIGAFLWGFGYLKKYEFSQKFDGFVTGEAFGGIGVINFRKDSNDYNYPEKWGFNIPFGLSVMFGLEYDEKYVFGWKRNQIHSRIKAEYDDIETGHLRHWYSTIFLVGLRFGAESCVPTAYVSCP
jgi:hypothetical protein